VRDETRLGLLALGAAAALGLLGDLLLRATPWGLNAPLWILALVVVGGLLVYQARLPLLGEGRWLVLAALAFAGGIALRDSPALFTVNLLAVLLTLGLAGHRARGGWPRIGGLPQYVGALISAGLHACGGVLVLTFYDVRWQEVPRTGWSAVVLAILRGLLIAIPLVMVFGALFMAADAVFSGIVTNLLAVNVRELFSHLFWTGVWTWLTAGFLRQALFCTIAIDGWGRPAKSSLTPLAPDDPRAADQASPPTPLEQDKGGIIPQPEGAGAGLPLSAPVGAQGLRPPGGEVRPGGRLGVLGIVELGVVLGMLDLLFLAFVVVQFRYLFGGAELVQVSSTLTYAEYARRGFFELVAVAALLLPIMLLLDWVARLQTSRQVVLYRALAGLLVLLLFVVVVSALERMRLYTQEYGLTELRLYTTAFMFWITAGAIWYLATVLRDHRERFLFGSLVVGLVVAGTLNAIDPDDLIVRTNAARPDAPSRFDGTYTLGLSADAGPALIEALPSMPEQQRVVVARRLLQRWESAQAHDWRSWNYGRWRSLHATAANEPLLRAAEQSQPSRSGQGSGGSRIDIPEPDRRP
jgi:hypothetical protein